MRPNEYEVEKKNFCGNVFALILKVSTKSMDHGAYVSKKRGENGKKADVTPRVKSNKTIKANETINFHQHIMRHRLVGQKVLHF